MKFTSSNIPADKLAAIQAAWDGGQKSVNGLAIAGDVSRKAIRGLMERAGVRERSAPIALPRIQEPEPEGLREAHPVLQEAYAHTRKQFPSRPVNLTPEQIENHKFISAQMDKRDKVNAIRRTVLGAWGRVKNEEGPDKAFWEGRLVAVNMLKWSLDRPAAYTKEELDAAWAVLAGVEEVAEELHSAGGEPGEDLEAWAARERERIARSMEE